MDLESLSYHPRMASGGSSPSHPLLNRQNRGSTLPTNSNQHANGGYGGVLIVIGLVALIVGAEIVVHASSWVATRLGVSPMVIGLTG